MRPTSSGNLTLSASDLGKFLVCRHSTALDLAVFKGLRKPPPPYPDPVAELLRQRGSDHEQAYVEKHRVGGKVIVELSRDDKPARTLDAMKSGADMIVQGALYKDGWGGYADILRRVERASGLGGWSYEVIDTKLARETKGTTILQLSLYSDILTHLQGLAPESFYVVTPIGEEPYRLADYAAYYRLVKRRLAEAVELDPGALFDGCYPEPVDFCEFCRWDQACKQKRRDDDHLSLVAGISRAQRRELEPFGVTTLEALGELPLPIALDIPNNKKPALERVANQARVQLEGRRGDGLVHELLPPEKGMGLARLPEPSPGDIFLDLEGDAFAREGGREYLFGLVTVDAKGVEHYEQHWAFTDTDECAAFERVMDGIMAAWDADPNMHIYHYHHYEPSAFKRLMGRYATRESDVDRLLRGERFVDLRMVVKQGLRASVEKYSIKDLEPFYGFDRSMDLRVAGDTRAGLERLLQMDAAADITDEMRRIVAAYNRDDCVSTRRLRDWLERLRSEVVAGGKEVLRPELKTGEPSENTSERDQRIAELVKQLTVGIPVDREERTPEQHARWLLANMLDYHRREDKADWWEFFETRDLEEDERAESVRTITGLRFVERVAMGRTRATDRYRFAEQKCRVREGDTVHDTEKKFGEVVAINRDAGIVDIIKDGPRINDHPESVFVHNEFRKDTLMAALDRVAESVIENGIEGMGNRAARALLMRELPRLRERAFVQKDGENATDFAVRVAPYLDGTVLPVQGPPGSGKTYTGARMICELVRRGMRVAVTASSHRVVDNMLEKVLELAAEEEVAVRCGHKDDSNEVVNGIRMFSDPKKSHKALRDGEIDVLGGTVWLWAGADVAEIADVLVVDEAGQMALPNVIVCSGAANSIVLLGDPQQLEQPSRGSHPEGTGVSGLGHILQEDPVITPDRGIFLPETWRMHPRICKFCSDVFYESKLTARPGLDKQALTGTGRFDGAGLYAVPVIHEGNQNDSPEEVEAVLEIVRGLLDGKAKWTDKKGVSSRIEPADILVVSPYNMQVMALNDVLDPLGVRAGTVDKFQGREAPVVIYSMAASSPSDASRGMEFLYSLSRLNVATSRAKCATILVASPLLFEPECKSPRQMKLANGLCSYVEMARVIA